MSMAMSIERARTDEELLAERGAGAAGAAFAEFYARHERAVLAYFRRRTGSPELAADLTGETFAQALVSRGSYRSQPGGSPVAWLFGIAGHVLARSARRGAVEDRARRRLGLVHCAADEEQLTAIERLSEDVELRGALQALPVDQRDAVWARVVQEHAYGEIAIAQSCSESVVRQRVSRGLAALRRQLKEST
jgi:RNA polymerase sigma-70 factor (ECF subfamily)